MKKLANAVKLAVKLREESSSLEKISFIRRITYGTNSI
jgi:hypothetical protein